MYVPGSCTLLPLPELRTFFCMSEKEQVKGLIDTKSRSIGLFDTVLQLHCFYLRHDGRRGNVVEPPRLIMAVICSITVSRGEYIHTPTHLLRTMMGGCRPSRIKQWWPTGGSGFGDQGEQRLLLPVVSVDWNIND